MHSYHLSGLCSRGDFELVFFFITEYGNGQLSTQGRLDKRHRNSTGKVLSVSPVKVMFLHVDNYEKIA